MFKRLLLMAILFLLKTSMTIAINSIQNGCSAYDCKRNCLNSEISATPGDNGFRFEIQGAKDKYVPGKTYTG